MRAAVAISSPARRRGRRPPGGWPAGRGNGRTGRGHRAGECPRPARSRRRSRCSVRLRRRVDGEPGGIEEGAGRPVEDAGQGLLRPGLEQAVEDLFLTPTEQLGQDPVDDDGTRSTLVSSATRSRNSIVSWTGISAGRGHDDQAGLGRVAEDVEHPPGLLADQADLHQVVDGLGGGQLADDVAAGGGVDDDDVVVAFAYLPAELADRHDLLDARARRRPTKSNILASGPDPGHEAAASAAGTGTGAATPRCPSTWPTDRERPPARRTRWGPSRRSRPGCPWRRPRRRASSCPDSAASRPRAAATVVLPVPPLPVTKTSLRSRSSTKKTVRYLTAEPKPTRRSSSVAPNST